MAYNNNITQNMEVIKELVHTDLQRRMFKQYNARTDDFNTRTDEDYDKACSNLFCHINGINTLKGVNDVLCHYSDLFTEYDELLVPTIDGTTNYVIDLLVKQRYTEHPDGMGMQC